MPIQDGWFAFDNDLNSVLDALKGTFVESGGACTQLPTPAMQVRVAAIVYYINGARVSKAQTDVTITAAPGSGARKDIIVGDSSGNITAVDGTAEAVAPSGKTGPETYQPKPSNIPANKVLIAEVYVPTGKTSILNADITDRRVMSPYLLGVVVPAARVYHSADQSVLHGICATLSFNSERFDTDNIHDTVTNNSRLTCKTAGKYLISVSISFTANTTGDRYLRIWLNGNVVIAAIAHRTLSELYNADMSIATIYELSVGDYVEVQVEQRSGTTLAVVVVPQYSPEFMIARVG